MTWVNWVGGESCWNPSQSSPLAVSRLEQLKESTSTARVQFSLVHEEQEWTRGKAKRPDGWIEGDHVPSGEHASLHT